MTESAAIHIPERHQSAPKEHWADKEIKKAAEEIDAGKWKPTEGELALEQLDDMAIALRTGPAAAIEKAPTPADYAHTRNTLELGQHPRVVEAMRRLETEKDESRSSQEYVEKTAMLFELSQAQASRHKWEGQERWQGKENEEMRYGRLLTPLQFYAMLIQVVQPRAVIGLGETTLNGNRLRLVGPGNRIMMGRDAVKTHPAAESARVPLFVAGRERIHVIMPGQSENDTEPMMVATLQWPLGTEWMVMNFDKFGVPTTQKYLGWRTALLSMIRAGVITEKEAHKAFPLREGGASDWYRQQLWEWNNHRHGVN